MIIPLYTASPALDVRKGKHAFMVRLSRMQHLKRVIKGNESRLRSLNQPGTAKIFEQFLQEPIFGAPPSLIRGDCIYNNGPLTPLTEEPHLT